MRNRSENDPSVVRPQTRPSRNPRTAKMDHRGSGTDFVWKNTTHETVSHPSHRRSRSWTFGTYFVGKSTWFHAAAVSQKHISCLIFSKLHRQLLHQHHLQPHLQRGNDPRAIIHNGIPSAFYPPAPLAIPFVLRERSYNYKSQ